MTGEIDPKLFEEPTPSEAQKALWDRFVLEYVKDFNPIAANIRLGFNAIYAKEYAAVFMSTPYIAREILKAKSTPVNEVDRLTSLKAQVESALVQAMNCGDPKISVLAATRIGEMHGFMQAPDKSGEELGKLVDAFKEIAKAVPD